MNGREDDTQYDEAAMSAHAARATLDSFRLLYDRQIEALKWISAFSLGVLLGLANVTVASAAPLMRPFYAAAMIALVISLVAALSFYGRYLRVAVFLHTAETRIGELNLAMSRLSSSSRARKPRPDLERLQQAKDALAAVAWPHDAEQRADERARQLCLAGFLVGISVLGATQLAQFILLD